jgi:hypothetical protein
MSCRIVLYMDDKLLLAIESLMDTWKRRSAMSQSALMAHLQDDFFVLNAEMENVYRYVSSPELIKNSAILQFPLAGSPQVR